MAKPIVVRAVLFDLDGTLVDSLPDLLNAANNMLLCLDRPAIGRAALEGYIGNGVVSMVNRLLTSCMGSEPAKALFEEALELFESHYFKHICEDSRLYPEVLEGLDLMRERGFAMGVVTNKADQFTHLLLKNLGIISYFSVVVSGDTLDTKKPAPEPLLHAASLLNACPKEALMVGDSVNDIQAARSAGCPVFCVSYGYRGGLSADQLKADRVVQSILKMNRLIVPANVGNIPGI